jgi:hypothetical protein
MDLLTGGLNSGSLSLLTDGLQLDLSRILIDHVVCPPLLTFTLVGAPLISLKATLNPSSELTVLSNPIFSSLLIKSSPSLELSLILNPLLTWQECDER